MVEIIHCSASDSLGTETDIFIASVKYTPGSCDIPNYVTQRIDALSVNCYVTS
jgi:hypothetical protein